MVKKIAYFTGITIVLLFALNILGVFNEAQSLVRGEFGPKALLKKYEWFKDASAQLDAKKSNIKVYQSRIDTLKEDYKGEKRKNWDRTDKMNINLWQQEVAGVIASYNGLAAEYNSQMSKINWSFANVGNLPSGQTEVLNREFKTYKIK